MRFDGSSIVLTLLVGYSTRGLAGRLAGGLALTATAVSRALLQRSAIERLDVGHGYLPPIQ